MYATEDCRGGIIEPEGIVEIKFRNSRLIAAMERLDPNYKYLKNKLISNETPESQEEFAKYEHDLLPIYRQAAVLFSDLHDRPERMVAKKAIKKIIPWRNARSYFYPRILRRVHECQIIKEIQLADNRLSYSDARKELVRMFFNSSENSIPSVVEEQDVLYEESDIDVVRWINNNENGIKESIKLIRAKAAASQKTPEMILESFLSIAHTLDDDSKRRVLALLSG